MTDAKTNVHNDYHDLQGPDTPDLTFLFYQPTISGRYQITQYIFD